MSSFKKRNLLLVTFGVLTILFGSLFAYEYVQVQQLKSSTTTTSTTTGTLTPSPTSETTETATSIVCFIDDTVNIKDVGTFAYRRETTTGAGNVVVLKNVTFAIWVNTQVTFTFGLCSPYRGYVITFQDGTSENMTACSIAFSPITTRLTTHRNPRAGLSIFPDGDVFLIVSI